MPHPRAQDYIDVELGNIDPLAQLELLHVFRMQFAEKTRIAARANLPG